MVSLLIPYGLNADGRLTHVRDVPRGKACGLVCPSCNVPLVARKGVVKQHHLAHPPGHPNCEGWLHSTAKLLLYQRITDAIAASAPLPIRWSCKSGKGHTQTIDLLGKRILNSAGIEQYLPDFKVRPDIVCMAGDAPKVLIEVVDSHAPEPPVIATGLPVLEVHISAAEDLETLAEGPVPVAVMRNYPCAECRKSDQERAEQERRRQDAKRRMLERLKDAGLEYRTGNLPPLTPIKQDKYGARLRRDTSTTVNGVACNLQRMGFQQRDKRATLFSLTVEPPSGGRLQVFADLDSTDTIRLWEHLEWEHTIPAALYAFPMEHPWRECALVVVGEEMDRWGFPNRRHFPDNRGWG